MVEGFLRLSATISVMVIRSRLGLCGDVIFVASSERWTSLSFSLLFSSSFSKVVRSVKDALFCLLPSGLLRLWVGEKTERASSVCFSSLFRYRLFLAGEPSGVLGWSTLISGCFRAFSRHRCSSKTFCSNSFIFCVLFSNSVPCACFRVAIFSSNLERSCDRTSSCL